METKVLNLWEVGAAVTSLVPMGTLVSFNPAKSGFYDQNIKGEKRVIFVVQNAEGKQKKVGCSTWLSKTVREKIITHGEESVKQALLNTDFGYDEVKGSFWFTTNTLHLTDVAVTMKAKKLTYEDLLATV
jgi:hypothetical protein